MYVPVAAVLAKIRTWLRVKKGVLWIVIKPLFVYICVCGVYT